MDRTERWLHSRRRAIRAWRDDGPGAVTQSLEEALAGVEALEAAGALSAGAAAEWRAIFAREADDRVAPAVDPETADRAQRFLAGLLASVPPEPADDDPQAERFEAAVHLLSAVGAVDARAWDARLRERAGWPTAEEERIVELALNEGGTEAELIEAIPGPSDARGGHRLVLVLRFADGVSFLLDTDPRQTPDIAWPEWQLVDDLGTSYPAGGAGGSDEGQHISFRAAIPGEATWIQLDLEGHPDVAFRVGL